MSFRIKQGFVALYALFTLLLPALYAGGRASATGCPVLPTDNGTASTTFTVKSAGVYRLWAHVHSSPSGGGTFNMSIDNGCPIGAGSDGLAASTFSWISNMADTSTPVTLNLTAGKHSLVVTSQETAVGVDRVLLLTSSSCVPVDNGSNCLGVVGIVSMRPPSGQTETGSAAVTGTIRLAVYLVVGVVLLTLVAFGLSRLLRRMPRAGQTARMPAQLPAATLPAQAPPQPPQQLTYGLTPSVTAPAPAAVRPLPGPTPVHKRKLMLAGGLCVIAGVIAVIVLIVTSKDVTISLTDATVAGQAYLVADAAAINGSMVQFGDDVVVDAPVGAAPTPAGGSTAPLSSPSAGSSGTRPASDSKPSGGSAPGATAPSSGPVTIATPVTPLKSVTCNYQTDTWSGDASGVGYTVSKLSASDGNPAAFSVKINARAGTTEVVGYPSDQCLLYSALPSNLATSFNITPPASSSGLDYEYAYDIWLTTATAVKASNWNNDLELMIWTYVNGQVPAGSVKTTLSDGSKIWIYGNNSTGIVSVVLPGNPTSGTVNIASLVGQLKSLGYINNSYDGILDVEYGIEAPYGGGQTFTVNAMAVGS